MGSEANGFTRHPSETVRMYVKLRTIKYRSKDCTLVIEKDKNGTVVYVRLRQTWGVKALVYPEPQAHQHV